MIRAHVHSVHFSTFHRESKRGALPRVLAALNKANALSKRSQLTWRIGADTLADGWRERGGNLSERSLFQHCLHGRGGTISFISLLFSKFVSLCIVILEPFTHMTEVKVLPCVTCVPCRACTSATFLSSIYVYTISSRLWSLLHDRSTPNSEPGWKAEEAG